MKTPHSLFTLSAALIGGAALVAGNAREFKRVKGRKVREWKPA